MLLLEAEGRKFGLRRIYLHVWHLNEAAIRLYTRIIDLLKQKLSVCSSSWCRFLAFETKCPRGRVDSWGFFYVNDLGLGMFSSLQILWTVPLAMFLCLGTLA